MKLLTSGEMVKAQLALRECIEKQIMISIQAAWKAKTAWTISKFESPKKK